MEKKEDFYAELDRKGRHSFCSCQTMALAFFILAILAAAGIVWASKKVGTAILPERKVTSNREDAVNFQQKVADLAKAPGAATTLTISERELTTVLVDAIAKDPAIPLRGVQAQINPSEVIISGTATKFVNSSLQIHILPKVVDGKIVLELVKIEAGALKVPSALTALIAKPLEDLLAKQLAQLQNVTVKSILLSDGKMTITGTITSGSPIPHP